MRGKFIVFEGIDGSGKTTVAAAAHKALSAKGVNAVLTREPTDSWLGDAVRRQCREDTSSHAELLLFLADRAVHTLQIEGWLGEGKAVICDRYADSTIAYQAVSLRKELGPAALHYLRKLHDGIAIRPDLTLLFDIEPETALRRISSRAETVKFEKLEFLRGVRENYLDIARGRRRYRIIDASGPLEQVTAEAVEAVAHALVVK